MKKQPKYKIGSLVWYMQDDKAVSSTVTGICFMHEGFHYWTRKLTGCPEWYDYHESELFPSKEALLKSL